MKGEIRRGRLGDKGGKKGGEEEMGKKERGGVRRKSKKNAVRNLEKLDGAK